MANEYYVQQLHSVKKVWINIGDKAKTLPEAEEVFKNLSTGENINKYGHIYRVIEVSMIHQTGV